jgi:two-component system NarL family sensor kinase
MGAIVVLAILAFATVGAAVATLRPTNGVGWLCLAVGLLLVVASVPQDLDSYGVPWRVLEPVSSAAWTLMVLPLPVTLMLLIFPEGRLPSRRWWVVAVASAG